MATMADDFVDLAAQAHAAYAAGDHRAAEQLYTAALDAAPASDTSTELLATLYANRAAARLRGDESSLTGMHDAGLALTLNPNLPRPRLRLATALAAAGREAEASEQATLVLGLPNLSAAMTREATAVLRQSAARTAASHSASMSGVTDARRRLVQRTQLLRVHLSPPADGVVRSGRWHTLSVRLSNEMGLFDAACFAAEARARVRLEVVALSQGPRPASLRMSVRQAHEPPPPPEAAAPNTAAAGRSAASLNTARDATGGGAGVWLRLHRGRATAEVRVDVEGDVEGGEGGGEGKGASLPSSVALWAEMWADAAPGADEGAVPGAASPTANVVWSLEGARRGERRGERWCMGLSPALPALSLPMPFVTSATSASSADAAAATLPPAASASATLASITSATSPLEQLRHCLEAITSPQALAAAAITLTALPTIVQGLRLLPARAHAPYRAPSSAPYRAPLVLAESASDIAGRLWDSGAQLAAWLSEGELLETTRREAAASPSVVSSVASPSLEISPRYAPFGVLELGAGIGVAGLAAAALGARVLLTDLEGALPLLKLNAAANAPLCRWRPEVAALEWGCGDAAWRAALQVVEEAAAVEAAGVEEEAVPAPPPTPPWLVLASDVVYEPLAYEPLLHTLRQLGAAGVATRTLMAHRSRHPDEGAFFTSAARHFAITQLRGPHPFVPIGACTPVPCAPGLFGSARGDGSGGGGCDGSGTSGGEDCTEASLPSTSAPEGAIYLLEFEYIGVRR
jgi:predicted nicotinamide N-methyase